MSKRSAADGDTLRRLVRRWWYTAIVENKAGTHSVFYSTLRPTIGATCPGIAAPNRVITYRRDPAPTTKLSFRAKRDKLER